MVFHYCMQKDLKKIGFPRALMYHRYHTMWHTFFSSLSHKIVVSPPTNKKILNNGVNLSVDESCLAVKIFLGHIDYLKDKVDLIFIPRYYAQHRNERYCVKFLALGDIARNTFPEIEVVDFNVDANKFQTEFVGYMTLGRQLGHSTLDVFKAYHKAFKKQSNWKKEKIEKQNLILDTISKERPKVLLVSRAYITEDAFLGKMVTKHLADLEVDVIFSDLVNGDSARKRSKKISTDLYWSYNKEMLGGIEMYKDSIDGIIFLMAFPCGPDALVVTLCQHKLANIPSASIVMDELQGDAGLKTRLESFVDILKMKKRQNVKNKKKS